MGIFIVEHDGSITENSYVVSGPNGIARSTLRKTNIKVLKVIDEKYAKVDIVIDTNLTDLVIFQGTFDTDKIIGLPETVFIDDVNFKDNKISIGSKKYVKLIIETFTQANISISNSTGVKSSFKRVNYTLDNKIGYKYSLKTILQPESYELLVENILLTDKFLVKIYL